MRIGLDLDGVIADIDIFQLRVTDFEDRKKIHKELTKWYYISRKVQFDPLLLKNEEDEIYIITSRYNDIKELTLEWLKKNNVYFDKIIFVPHKPENGIGQALEDWYKRQAMKKAKILKENNIEVYFEDCPSTVKYLREMCPDIKIIQYGRRLE